MKNSQLLISGRGLYIIAILLFQFIFSAESAAQYQGINEDIAKLRKGELIVKAKPGDKVTVEQLTHEFWFGCAITNGIAGDRMQPEDKRQYKEKFLENFNSAVTENAVKWIDMERKQGEVNYTNVDGILKWTEENNIPLRGHNIFWGIPNRVQPWLKEMNDDDLRKALKNRAETLAAHYKGRFAEYDLNNEMVHGNYYEDRLGPDITKQMAEWVHNGDPDAKLYLNDYDILTGKMLPEYMAQIRKLLKQGVPIAGIGVQGHLHAESFDRQALRDALDSLSIFKLPIRVTEFNMPGQRSKFLKDTKLEMTPQEEEQKAKDIVDYYRICFAHPQVEGMIMWGFWAGANWIPASSLYRRDWSPTPAADAYKNLIFKEWWTKASGSTDKKGNYSTAGFYGKYKVSVNGVSKEVNLDKANGKTVVDFTK
jgi:endo-1,4-beta-xylanase